MSIDDACKLASEFGGIKSETSPKNTKRRKISENSEEEFSVIVTIEGCDTDSPILKDVTEKNNDKNTVENQDACMKVQSEDDSFRIPDSSLTGTKSRTGSEKSLNEKNIPLIKVQSEVSGSTICTPSTKLKPKRKRTNTKVRGSWDLTNTTINKTNSEAKLWNSQIDLSDEKNVPALPLTPEAKKNDRLFDMEWKAELKLDASEHIDDIFNDNSSFKNFDDYHMNNLEFPEQEPVDSKVNYGLSHNNCENEYKVDVHMDNINKMSNLSIDEYDHREPSFNMQVDHYYGGLMDEAHIDDFHFAGGMH